MCWWIAARGPAVPQFRHHCSTCRPIGEIWPVHRNAASTLTMLRKRMYDHIEHSFASHVPKRSCRMPSSIIAAPKYANECPGPWQRQRGEANRPLMYLGEFLPLGIANNIKTGIACGNNRRIFKNLVKKITMKEKRWQNGKEGCCRKNNVTYKQVSSSISALRW